MFSVVDEMPLALKNLNTIPQGKSLKGGGGPGAILTAGPFVMIGMDMAMQALRVNITLMP